MLEASFQNTFNLKNVLWSFLFLLVPCLWSLGEHASSCSCAKMTTWKCINLEMEVCINRAFHNLLQMAKHVPLPSHTLLCYFLKNPKQEDFHAHSCFHAFGQKEKMEGVQACWLHYLSHANLLLLSPLYFPCPKLTKLSLGSAWKASCYLTLIFTPFSKLAPQQIFSLGQHFTSLYTLYI